MPPGNSSKADSAATKKQHRYKVKRPQIKAEWDKEAVIPQNDSSKSADAKAVCKVTSEYPVNRPVAEINILPEGSFRTLYTITALKLANKKVVTAKGEEPVHYFTLADHIWEPWDKLTHDFEVEIGTGGYALTEKPIKVKRWHVNTVDMSDTRPSFPPMRTSEGNNFEAAFAGSADDTALAWQFQADTASAADYGGMLKNTYCAAYTGHGAVVCGICNTMYDCITDVPTSNPKYGRWTTCPSDKDHANPISTHCIGPFPWLQAGDVKDEGLFPSTPKFLMFSVCCGGAFEPSLFDAYISRGTAYAIGFRKSTLCTWARDYAQSFFTTWAKTHKCDPAKIPDVYKSMYATWSVRLEPVLFPQVPEKKGSTLSRIVDAIKSIF